MLGLAINTYVHILCVIIVISCLVIQRFTIKSRLKWESLKLLLKADKLYGLAAIVVATTGLLNWFYFGKGGSYYSGNTIFIIKFSLFIVVGLLSIYPTFWFSRYKRRHRSTPPERVSIDNIDRIKLVITLELAIMAIIPLLATLMANGVGFW